MKITVLSHLNFHWSSFNTPNPLNFPKLPFLEELEPRLGRVLSVLRWAEMTENNTRSSVRGEKANLNVSDYFRLSISISQNIPKLSGLKKHNTHLFAHGSRSERGSVSGVFRLLPLRSLTSQPSSGGSDGAEIHDASLTCLMLPWTAGLP